MKANLLLVEDHDDTRAALAKVLMHHGYRVETAASGTEALRLAGEQPFDLVLMDHGLPDGNGCEFMQTLHRDFALDGIAITANAYATDERKSDAAGFLAHLSKPVNIKKLCDVLAHHLGEKNERDEAPARLQEAP